MLSVFISYNNKDLKLAKRIAETLRFMGIAVWMDKDNLDLGNRQEEEIKNTIKGFDGVISLITPNSMISDYVILEIKTALKIKTERENYLIIPLIQKINFKKIKDWSLEKFGVNLSAYTGFELVEKVNYKHLVDFSKKVLGSLISANIDFKELDQIMVQIFSKEIELLDEETVFAFNFTSLINKEDKIIQEKLQHSYSCIRAFKEVLSTTGYSRTIFIRNPRCHLSIGLVFGFVFRQTSGYLLKIEYFKRIYETILLSETSETNIKVNKLDGSIKNNPIIFELSISNDVESNVSSMISDYSIDYRRRISIIPHSGISRTIALNNTSSNQYAKNIVDTVRKESLENVGCSVILVVSSPLFLALLIGWQLNASGDIQLYEFHNSSKRYYPSFVLK